MLGEVTLHQVVKVGAIADPFSARALREPLLSFHARIQSPRDVAANLLASQLPRAVGTPTNQDMYVRGIRCDCVASKLLALAGFERPVDQRTLDRRRELDDGLFQISAIALRHVCIGRQNFSTAMHITPRMIRHPTPKGMIREEVAGHVRSLPQPRFNDHFGDLMFTFMRLQVDCEKKR